MGSQTHEALLDVTLNNGLPLMCKFALTLYLFNFWDKVKFGKGVVD